MTLFSSSFFSTRSSSSSKPSRSNKRDSKSSTFKRPRPRRQRGINPSRPVIAERESSLYRPASVYVPLGIRGHYSLSCVELPRFDSIDTLLHSASTLDLPIRAFPTRQRSMSVSGERRTLGGMDRSISGVMDEFESVPLHSESHPRVSLSVLCALGATHPCLWGSWNEGWRVAVEPGRRSNPRTALAVWMA